LAYPVEILPQYFAQPQFETMANSNISRLPGSKRSKRRGDIVIEFRSGQEVRFTLKDGSLKTSGDQLI
jgi:hypothetical protein